ncbi:iron complex transport system ATP-binding protein [Loktanella fryxellensis]|uniref:Iron complex transport system ATP-binding protein n=1 Tax=Loktanella fryxellensis TaxID=245187 RepID=A0A1H8IQH6_9RHOB|nr:ATP-binding cassette domain-containing protein [Loktanella fryxellensis]SEN70345.1 iron complex transport system ATP-binding protein [Loktanella fryxellensis]
MIAIESLCKSYDGTPVLDGVDLILPQGGVTAVIGPNGAGKSTLLSVMGRMIRADAGRVTLDGRDLATAPGSEVARRLAVLRQDNQPSARLTVQDLVTFGRYPHSHGRTTAQDRVHVARAIAYLGLGDLADRFLDELSGGQRQRAFIAMVLAQDTDVILLDEPLNNLDMRHAVGIMALLRDAARDLGKTILVVLHDINMAAAYCDRIVVMQDGRLIHHGPPEEIMTDALLSRVYATPVTVHRVAGRLVALY